MHSSVKHNIVVKTGCMIAVAPILSVTLVDKKAVVSDSISCLDLMVVDYAEVAYSMPGVPYHVLP